MTDQANKLEPCPFCGSEAESRQYDGEHFVQCTQCFNSTSADHQTEASAIAAWNRRAALPVSAPSAGSAPSDVKVDHIDRFEASLSDLGPGTRGAAALVCGLAKVALLAQYGAQQDKEDAEPWLPIETAPKDDATRFIGLLKNGRAVTARGTFSVIVGPEKPGGGREVIGSKFSGYAEDCGDALVPRTFTHWMPLPAAPNDAARAADKGEE